MGFIHFTVNGEPREVKAQAGATLLQYLRGVACLKGTKEGCGTGHCGACTVLMDGRPVRSCVTKLERAADRNILTIEGLGGDSDRLHPVQQAFLDVGMVQCGFCTPGLVLAAKALLDADPAPDRPAIHRALKHNYCRCSGYVKIIEGVELAAARMRGENPAPAEYRTLEKTRIIPSSEVEGYALEYPDEACRPASGGKYLGRSIIDGDLLAKVRGTLEYAGDLAFPGQLYGAFAWTKYPKAKITSIDTAEAEACPGVVRVLTWKDVPGDNHLGTFLREQPVFCQNEVNFLGEMIALAVAEDERSARAAAALVRVGYEELPGVYSMEDGLARGAVMGEITHRRGDVDLARTEKDLLVISRDYTIERVEHGCLEPESALGRVDENGLIHVLACTQSPFEIRNMLARILDLPAEKVRVTATPLGGGFGSKCDATIEAAAGVAAYCLRRPVLITLNRAESMLLSTKRHAYRINFELAVNRQGEIRYIAANEVSDAGPYDNLSTGVLEQSCIFSGGPYRVENAHIRGRAVRTNNVLGGAFRGFGINQAAFCVETMMDEAAEALGLDPIAIRKINALRPGDYTITGERVVDSVGIHETLTQAERLLAEARRALAGYRPGPGKKLGFGVASGYKNVGVGKGYVDDGGCIIIYEPDGRVTLRLSGVDMGQGFRTAMRQLAAEALDRPTEDFTLLCGDTELTLNHSQAVSERQTLVTGTAVVKAAEKMRRVLAETPWSPGETRRAEYHHTAAKTYSLMDVEGREKAGDEYRNYPALAYLTQCAVIEVDTDSGRVKVLKVISVHDVGRAINPLVIEGQIEGSCSMGIGYALSEAYPSENGYPRVKFYGQLGIPTIDETPEYDLVLVEDPEPAGPFGAKGISEVATVPITPAVINAVHDAVGVRIRTLPATPEVILAALAEQQRARF